MVICKECGKVKDESLMKGFENNKGVMEYACYFKEHRNWVEKNSCFMKVLIEQIKFSEERTTSLKRIFYDVQLNPWG